MEMNALLTLMASKLDPQQVQSWGFVMYVAKRRIFYFIDPQVVTKGHKSHFLVLASLAFNA